jgi:hypothetical protein
MLLVSLKNISISSCVIVARSFVFSGLDSAAAGPFLFMVSEFCSAGVGVCTGAGSGIKNCSGSMVSEVIKTEESMTGAVADDNTLSLVLRNLALSRMCSFEDSPNHKY